LSHAVHTVTRFEEVAPFTLRVWSEDGTTQVVDFRPVLSGQVFGPLADPRMFNQVRLDEESGTLVWPNGADFDPATLHDWGKRDRGWPRSREAGSAGSSSAGRS
jgi:hypothetical protein